MFANTQMSGLSLAVPDVCLTPVGPAVVPVPYPNMALSNTAVPSAFHILVQAAPIHNMATVVPLTNGDNAGVGMGVASGLVMGPSRHLTGAFTVLFAGMPVTRMGSLSMQNSTNAVGAQIAPSQTKMIVLAG